jgi:tetratricopeptide (TPR) repeat protein
MLPLLLGLLGLFFQAMAGDKGIQGFWVTFFLFFMTGLAILLYLNQTPLQPRERDYAYAGSFYAFCIWIGLGVPAIVKILKKFLPETPASILVTVMCLGVPVLMAAENWDDHDRSGRYTARDFAKNYLMSCEENGIIFTNGDNDTFPLWYIQEVEGYRTDVRVCNLSYLQTDWYVDQMRRPYYNSDALPISWTEDMYSNGKRDIARVIKLTEDSISLNMALEWVKTDDEKYKTVPGFNEKIDFIPAEKLFYNIDTTQLADNKYLTGKYLKMALPQLKVDLAGKNYLGKHELMILEMINENKWKRPIYYAVTVEESQYLGLKNSFLHEGLAYKVAPLSSIGGEPTINTDKMYDLMVNKYLWGNVQDPNVYLDENNLRMCRTHRHMMTSLAKALYEEKDFVRAEKTLDRCLEVLPINTIPANYSNIDMAKLYYQMGKNEKAFDLIKKVADNSVEYLEWLYTLKPEQYLSANILVNTHLFTLQEVVNIINVYDKDKLSMYMDVFQKHAQLYQQAMSARNAGAANR